MRARAFVRDMLAPHLPIAAKRATRKPGQWRYIDHLVKPDALDGLTLVVNQNGIQRLAQAPGGARDVTIELTLVSALDDFELAEAELEDAVEVLLDAIEEHLPAPWEPASKVLYQDTYLAWEVPVRIITT